MQKRSSILCPNCRKLINSDERICPYCNTLRPGSPLKNNPLMAGVSNPKKVALAIIWANVGMFIISILFSAGSIGMSMNPLDFLSPSGESLLILGATGQFPIDQFARWWTVVSAMYLHGSILHILFNMIMFWQFVPIVTKEYGASRMFIIYTVGGIAGYLASYFSGTYLTVGASGAVCALGGSLLYFGKSRGGQYGQALYSQIFGWVITLVIFGFIVSRVDNWAHGGGIVAGIALGWLLGYEEREREKLIHKTIGGICAISTIAVLLWAIGSAGWLFVQ